MRVPRIGRLSVPAAVLLLLASGSRAAPAQLLGPEFLVNTYITGSQNSPAVAADGAGNFVVVWQSAASQDGSGYGVFAQRYDSAGALLGSEFQVNSYTTSYQSEPSVAADGSGNFIVVWRSNEQDGSNYGVFGQRFDSAGSLVGSEFQVNSATTNAQVSPSVTVDGSGNFVVVWQSTDQDGSSRGVFGQRYDSSGSRLGSEFQVNSYTTNDQSEAAVSADSAGNFVVVWFSYGQDDGSQGGVFAQRFDASGSLVGSEFQINSYTTDFQENPAVAMDGTGGFVVAWESYLQDESMGGVFGQRFDAAGGTVGSEFQVHSFTTSNQTAPAVAVDGAGNFVVAWQSYGQDGSLFGVFGQRYNPAGGKLGREFQVSDYTTATQQHAAVAAIGSGNFVVTWQSEGQDEDGEGVFGRKLSWIFTDDFETGRPCAWSTAVGSSDPCK